MSETQARRRKDKRKKKGRGDASGISETDQWPESFQPTGHDDDEFYVEPDSVSDDGTGDEEVKDHSEGGSSCLTVVVFLVLLAGVGVLVGLIYIQSQGIEHVKTPMPDKLQAAPRVETVVEEVVVQEPAAAPPPADDSVEAPPGAEEDDAAEHAGDAQDSTLVEENLGPVEAVDEGVDVTPPAEEEEGVTPEVQEEKEEEVAMPAVEKPVIQEEPARRQAGDSAQSVPVVDKASAGTVDKPGKPGGESSKEKPKEEKKAKEKPEKEAVTEKPKKVEDDMKAKPTEAPKPKPAEVPKPKAAEAPKPTEAPKPAEAPKPKPTEAPKPAEAPKPKSAETPKSKPKEEPKAKLEEEPKPKSAEASKPTEAPKPAEAPKPKPTEAPKPAEASKPKPTEAPKPEPTEAPKSKPTERPKPKPTEKPAKKETKEEKKATPEPVKEEKPRKASPAEEAEIKRVQEGKKPETAKKQAEPEKPKVAEKKPEVPKSDATSKKPAGQPDAASARADSSAKRDTDKHAKHTNKAAPAPDEGIEPDMEGYDKADVTGPEDWPIREELDAAEAVLETDWAGGLRAFGAILARQPRSPRALWGRARALNAQAQAERSNNVLDKAIEAFRAVLDLDLEEGVAVPPALFRSAAETCVQQMRFRGLTDKASRIQQRLIQKFPDDYMLRNHLAMVFLTYGQVDAAEEVLTEVLRLWPNNGYAKVHLGHIRRQQGRHEEAVVLLREGLASEEPGVHDKLFYHNLGESYQRLAQHDKAKEVYEEAVSRGLLLSPLQRSLYNVDRLTGRPFWTKEQTGSTALIDALESNWTMIRDEMLSLLDSDRPEDGFQDESESLSRQGSWKQYKLFARGHRDNYACAKLPKTCGLVQQFAEAAGCRRGQVKFSMLSPGTKVWPHTGPTNCRLRLHLGLIVPKGTGIRVAGEERTWEEGKVLVIDDSFEHEVWNDGDRARFILIVDIWHPELTDEERKTLRAI